MILKRLTSIALITALTLPNSLLAIKKNHYLAEADSEGVPLMNVTSTTLVTPTENPPPSTNTFVSIPLGSSSSTPKAKTPTEIESQAVPSRKPFICTTERLNCITGCIAYTFLGLMFLGLIGEMIWIMTRSPSDPCANQTTTPTPMTSDLELAPATLGPSGRGRTVSALHHYQKRRGGGVKVVRICNPTTTRSSTTLTSTLLSNFYELTSSSSTSTDTASTDATPPPLVQQPQE